MQRLNVPGGWIDVREPEAVPERLRRNVVMLATAGQGLTTDGESFSPDDMAFVNQFNDAVAICLVAQWSWTDVPVSIEGLLELPIRAYEAIVQHGQKQVAALMPNFSVDPDPKALGGS